MLIFNCCSEPLYVRQMPKRYKNKEDLTACDTKLTVPDAGLPGLEGVVLHPVSGVTDDFGVLPVLAVAVLLLLGAAAVPEERNEKRHEEVSQYLWSQGRPR